MAVDELHDKEFDAHGKRVGILIIAYDAESRILDTLGRVPESIWRAIEVVYVLEHLHDPELVLSVLKRHLKVGGASRGVVAECRQSLCAPEHAAGAFPLSQQGHIGSDPSAFLHTENRRAHAGEDGLGGGGEVAERHSGCDCFSVPSEGSVPTASVVAARQHAADEGSVGLPGDLLLQESKLGAGALGGLAELDPPVLIRVHSWLNFFFAPFESLRDELSIPFSWARPHPCHSRNQR